MTSFSRKLKRKKQLESRKLMQKQMENMLRITSSMEKKCGTCGKDFSEASKDEALKWMVRYNGVSTVLQCDVCFSMQEGEKEHGDE